MTGVKTFLLLFLILYSLLEYVSSRNAIEIAAAPTPSPPSSLTVTEVQPVPPPHNYPLNEHRIPSTQQLASSMGGLLNQNSSSVISLQSTKEHSSNVVASGPDSKPKKKICCACPETKKQRDECVVEHGESSCEKLIEAHRKCLRAEGFNI